MSGFSTFSTHTGWARILVDLRLADEVLRYCAHCLCALPIQPVLQLPNQNQADMHNIHNFNKR